jgi:hypothetical protein
MYQVNIVVVHTVSIFLINKGRQQISSSISWSKHTSFRLRVLIHNLLT